MIGFRLVRYLITAFLILCYAGTATASVTTGTVVHVFDGDTVKLMTGERVRLAGIDTPERDPEQYYYREACVRMRELVSGSNAAVRIHVLTRDRYGRLVAELFTPDGESLSERMLSEGMATFYYHTELPEPMIGRLMAAQRMAIAQRKGLWRGVLNAPCNAREYVGNRNSRRFFSTAGTQWERIGKRNRIWFSSLEEAYTFGYAPARCCDIFPKASEIR